MGEFLLSVFLQKEQEILRLLLNVASKLASLPVVAPPALHQHRGLAPRTGRINIYHLLSPSEK
jgi:hypothetical protein